MRTKLFTLVPVAVISAVLGLGMLTAQTPAAAEDANATTQSDPMQFANGAKTWADTCARVATTCATPSHCVTINGVLQSRTCEFAQD